MATPRRKPVKKTTNSTPTRRKVTSSTPKQKPKPTTSRSKSPATYDELMAAAKNRNNSRIPSKKSAIDPESFAGVISALKAAFGGKPVTVLDVPWEERDIARALGAQWIEKIKTYVYVGPDFPERLDNYASKDYSYYRWIEDQLNGRIKPTKKPVDGYYTLKDHQKEGVEAIRASAAAGWRGFLEADATGLGKSLVGLLGANEVAKLRGFSPTKKAKLVIICPNGAIAHWRNTIRHAQADHLRIMIISYDSSKNLLTLPKSAQNVKKRATKNRHIAAKGKPFIHWDIIIADESQKLMNPTSQRSQTVERIAQYAMEAKTAPYVIWMSATAGQTPLELGYLCPIIGQAARTKLTMESWPEWLEQNGFHVKKKKEKWQWVKPSGPNDAIAREQQKQDTERLAKILFHPKAPSIRRRPEEISGWPPVTRIAMPVQLSSANRDKYNKLWTEFHKEMKLKGRTKDPKDNLTKQLRFAQKASLLRVGQTVDNIIELLSNQYQVAVSVRFLETLDAIRAGLKKEGIECSEFSGRPYIDREKERIAFQKGHTRVMLFTVEEAVSFHAGESLPDGTKGSTLPRALLIHDLRYSGSSITQIIGRTHRDGQKSNAYFIYGEDTIEERILHVVLNRINNMASLSGDDTEESVIEEVLDEILKD